jgi:cytochrome c biogenesis protein CcdA
MDRGFLGRIGVFFLMIGCLLLILFAGSVVSNEYNLLYLLVGGVAIFLGISFYRRAAPPPPSTRFSSLKKLRKQKRPRGRGNKDEKEEEA